MLQSALRAIFLLVFASSVTPASAQPANKEVLEKVATTLHQQISVPVADQVILHLDKPYYYAGTTVWFRVYQRNALTGRLSDNLGNLMIDLYDESDSSVTGLILNGKDGSFTGGLQIPNQLPEGKYYLRAWIADVQGALAGEVWQPILIVNDLQKEPTAAKTSADMQSVGPSEGLAFFPEGGKLVSGSENLVVVKYQPGKASGLTGRVYDDRHKLMSVFRLDDAGSAQFELLPVAGRRYTTTLVFPDGREHVFSMPEVDAEACMLRLMKRDSSHYTFRVVLGDSLYQQKAATYILGVSGGQICFAGMGNGMYEASVPLDKFRLGRAVFYLFHSEGRELARREVMIQKASPRIDFKTERDQYATRQKVKAEIQVTDASGQRVEALLSIAVTDDRMVGQRPPGHPATASDMEEITQSSNRISSSTLPPLGADSGLVISGKILDRRSSPARGRVITVFPTGSQLVLSDTADQEGLFSFPPIFFADGTPFLAQVSDQQGKKQDARIELNRSPVKETFVRHPDLQPGGQWERVTEFRRLKADSFIRGNTITWLRSLEKLAAADVGETSTVRRRSGTSYKITAEQLDRLTLGTTANAVLMIPGVMVIGGKITIRGGTQSVIGDRVLQPLYLVDGIPYPTEDVMGALNSLNPHMIDLIEVMPGSEASIWGTRSGNGVISVYTSKQIRQVKGNSEPGVQFIYPKGYHLAPAFNAPNYDNYDVREASFNDNRSTLYWNGELILKKDAPGKIGFYTSDIAGSFTVRICGITAAGDWIEESFQINRR